MTIRDDDIQSCDCPTAAFRFGGLVSSIQFEDRLADDMTDS